MSIQTSISNKIQMIAIQSKLYVGSILLLFLVACSATKPPEISEHHIHPGNKVDDTTIPSPVVRKPFLAPPKPHVKQETYTVVVNDVPLKELLFALARDAKLNIDIHPGIEGRVTINAINQTLLQILNRLSDQIAINYKIDGSTLTISPDIPFLRSYDIGYVNVKRVSNSTVSVATQIATAGGSSGDGGGSGNSSQTSMTLSNENDFWNTITKNIERILENISGEASTGSASENSQEGDSRIIVNPISGVISIYATQRQHKEIQLFLDRSLANAQRQVLIEATIVEVELGDRYQSGIDWSVVSNKSGSVITAAASMTPSNLQLPPTFLLGYEKNTANQSITSALRFLEEFGETKVLSSPKIIALNNQTALLKVVDEKVYFTVDMEEERNAETGAIIGRTYTSEVHTVPVGVIMSVTPQINKNGNVSLSVRPTISRITGYVADPTPRLQGANFDNLIPEIQVREMESLLQVQTGQTVILGGLMQNTIDKNTAGVPWVATLPVIGGLFRQKDDLFKKTELVVFLRPVVTGHSDSIEAERDLSGFMSSIEEAQAKSKRRSNEREAMAR